MIGGITYFHKFAYDLLAENERIMASTFDAAIEALLEETDPQKVEKVSQYLVEKSARLWPIIQKPKQDTERALVLVDIKNEFGIYANVIISYNRRARGMVARRAENSP